MPCSVKTRHRLNLRHRCFNAIPTNTITFSAHSRASIPYRQHPLFQSQPCAPQTTTNCPACPVPLEVFLLPLFFSSLYPQSITNTSPRLGVLIECDPSIKSIIVNIDSVNHDFIIEDLDEERVVVKENMVHLLKQKLEDVRQTLDASSLFLSAVLSVSYSHVAFLNSASTRIFLPWTNPAPSKPRTSRIESHTRIITFSYQNAALET